MVTYKVLSVEGHDVDYTNHVKAFNYCEGLECKLKGVYRIDSLDGDLIPVNEWGNFFTGAAQTYRHNTGYTFKVG